MYRAGRVRGPPPLEGHHRELADRLFVTEKTVETHVASILGKVGLETQPDDHRRVLAVLVYLRAG